MIKRMIKIAPQWVVASFLFFTHMPVHADLFSPACGSPCDTNEYCDSFWVDADYLCWKIQNSPEAVPLVIQGPTLAIPAPVLGAPDTSVVLGGKRIDTNWRSGGKVALGYWLDSNHSYGAEIDYCFLPNASKKYSVSSDGSASSPFLLVPFYNVTTGAEDSAAVAFSLLEFEGTATLKLVNMMQGAEFNVLAAMPSSNSGSKIMGLAGFRYWNFNEHLIFTTSSPYIPPHIVDTYQTKDKFSVGNNFYGCQLGLIYEYDNNGLSITAKGKIALGAMCERLIINGHLLTNDYDDFGAVLKYPGGYFALPTNIGKHSQTKFAAIPELNFDIGYQWFDWMKIKLGYTFMYVSNVLWAGKQIDRNINPTQATSYTNAVPAALEGIASPKASLKTDDLWVQGLNVGVEFKF